MAKFGGVILDLCVKFHAVEDVDLEGNFGSSSEMLCTLDVMLVKDGVVFKVRRCVFKEMCSYFKLSVMVDQIFREKLKLLGVYLNNECIVKVVSELLDRFPDCLSEGSVVSFSLNKEL